MNWSEIVDCLYLEYPVDEWGVDSWGFRFVETRSRCCTCRKPQWFSLRYVGYSTKDLMKETQRHARTYTCDDCARRR